MLVVSIVLFGVSAILYIVAAAYLFIEGRQLVVPVSEVGNWFGIAGMVTVPIFVATAIIVNWREKHKHEEDEAE